jgi:hypothetical protein
MADATISCVLMHDLARLGRSRHTSSRPGTDDLMASPI